MVYCTSDLCESGKFGIPVQCKCCREVHRCLREAGHAIVAADCHLVWHAMQNYLPFYLSCIHPLARPSISVLIIIISAPCRY